MKTKTLKIVEEDDTKTIFFLFMSLVSFAFVLYSNSIEQNFSISSFFGFVNVIIYFVLAITTEPKEKIVEKKVVVE